MPAEKDYFAYCLDKNHRENNFIVPSKFLEPRQNARHLYPGFAWYTLGQEFRGFVFQSAWHESLEVDPDDGSFLDQKPKTDKDFEHLLTNAKRKKCLVLATASSLQELQEFVQSVNDVQVLKKCRRLDFSVTSGSQQHDEPQQDNEQFMRRESNPQTSNNPTYSKSSELPNSATFLGGDTHKRPEGVANLGYFESEIDGKITPQNADNVCVLVINYLCKDPDYIKNGDDCDVESLRNCFEKNRNCNFRDYSPNKQDLLDLLGDQEKLMEFFELKDDVPSVFVLFILSHGNVDGEIETDAKEVFTTDEVLDKLQGLERFQNCLKIVNFALCRGKLHDSKFDIEKSQEPYENRNPCRITNRPGMHNFVVFYSTVELTTACGDTTKSSWFVEDICTCLNSADDDESLLKFFTIVQSRKHESLRSYWSATNVTLFGQTPELKMFTQDRKFIISKARDPYSNTDSSVDLRNFSNERPSQYFSWKSDDGQDIRGRRGFIFSVDHSHEKEMKRVLENLEFIVNNWTLRGQSIASYAKMVSELEPDVGCIMTCVFGPVCENEQKEVCVRVQEDREIPITDILHKSVGPKNEKLIGKPKILFVVNVEPPVTHRIPDKKYFQVSATNHSGWLVLILKYKDAAEKLIELFGNIGDKSLQDLLEPLLTRESKREDMVLLNSTLQFLIQFPLFPRVFVKPDFKLKNTQIPLLGSKARTEKSLDKKIEFDQLMEEAKRLFEENKKSIANRNKNPKISNDIEFSNKSNPVEDSAASIVWLFNSVGGSGKSTVLKEMRYQLTKYDAGFKVLLIPLRDKYEILNAMNIKNVDKIEFLAKTTSNSQKDILNWIEKRELIVFFDEFNEVSQDSREKIIKILIALNQARVPLFIGTRPHQVSQIQDKIENSTLVEIEPLNIEKQIEYLDIVGRKNQQEIKQLRKIVNDQDILGNPFCLNLLAEYSVDGSLYEIIDKIVRKKLEKYLRNVNHLNDCGLLPDNKMIVIQSVASRFIRGEKIDQGSVSKENFVMMKDVGLVNYSNGGVNFTHQIFAEFLTAKKFIDDLIDEDNDDEEESNDEKVPLFNDELMQCRKFVDLFFSTEKGKDATYTEAFKDCAKSADPLELLKQICRENLSQMFRLLNPDISLKDEKGKNALHFALRHLEMVKMVHAKDPNLVTEITKYGENFLHLAIDDEECSEDVAIWLMENTEVDKNAETKFKDTPILLACTRSKWEVAKELVLAGVELNKSHPWKESILHYAVRSNKSDLVRALLNRGSNVHFKNSYGQTALHLAAMSNENEDIVKLLLKKGATVNEQDCDGRTALYFATRCNPESEVVQKLLEKDADVNMQNRKGIRALHLADADINLTTKDGETALNLATQHNPVKEIVQKLRDHETEVNKMDVE